MSNDKPIAIISQAIESEDSYKRNIETILNGIAKSQKTYINGVLKVASEVLKSHDFDVKHKFLALQLLHDCMGQKRLPFLTSVVESDILSILERTIVSFPKTEEEIISQYGPKPHNENAKKYYILIMEFIKFWAIAFEEEDENDALPHFPALYQKLKSKGAKFPTTFYFLQKDQKNGDTRKKEDDNGKLLDRIAALSQTYKEILEQPFFYNAQEIEEDNGTEEEHFQNEILEENLQDPFVYHAQNLEADENYSQPNSRNYIDRNVKQPEFSEFSNDFDDDVDFDIIDPIEKKPKFSHPIKQFTAKEPQPQYLQPEKPKNTHYEEKVYKKEEPLPQREPQAFKQEPQPSRQTESYNSKQEPQPSKPIEPQISKQESQPSKQTESNTLKQEPQPSRQVEYDRHQEEPVQSFRNQQQQQQQQKPKSANNLLSEPSRTRHTEVVQPNPVVKSTDIFHSGSLNDVEEDEEQVRPLSIKTIENEKRTRSAVFQQIDESPEFRIGHFEEEEERRGKVRPKNIQNFDSKTENTIAVNRGAASQVLKSQEGNSRVQEEPSRSSRKDIEIQEAPISKSQVQKLISPQKMNSQKGLEEDTSIEENKNRVTKSNVHATSRASQLNAGSLKDADDTERSQNNIGQKTGSLILDQSVRNKSLREDLEEIAYRINKGKEARSSASDINLSRRLGDETKSFIDVAGERRLKIAGSPNRQSVEPQRLQQVLPNEYTNIESYFEKEINELKKKNEKLLEENQKCKIKEAQLEVRLAQEVEKNQELRNQLAQKDEELKESRKKIESYLSPKKTFVNKPETPMSSPKSEMFKRNAREFKGTKVNGIKPTPRIEKPRIETLLSASMGPFLRSQLENDREYLSSRRQRSDQFHLQVSPKVFAKTEFASPKVNHQSMKQVIPQPVFTRKPFQGHQGLPFSTDAALFRSACLKDSEVIFEDQHLQIVFQTKSVEGGESIKLKSNIIYRNKTQADLEEFTVTYKSADGFEINADDEEIEQIIRKGENQIHSLNIEMVSPSSQIGTFIIEYRINEEPHQTKLHFPITMIKFLKFHEITSSDFIKKRKHMQRNNPGESETSQKVKMNQGFLQIWENYFFSKLNLLETQNANEVDRFTLYGGYIKLSEGEILIRFIIENDTLTTVVQINYDERCRDYANDLMKIMVLLLNEKILLL